MARFKKCAELEEEIAEVAHPGQTSFVAFMKHVRPDLQITPQVELLAHLVEGPLLRGEGCESCPVVCSCQSPKKV